MVSSVLSKFNSPHYTMVELERLFPLEIGPGSPDGGARLFTPHTFFRSTQGSTEVKIYNTRAFLLVAEGVKQKSDECKARNFLAV